MILSRRNPSDNNEVTHSFPVQKNNNDYISNHYLKNKNVEHILFLPFIKSEKLDFHSG